jgi:hypothetical protein
VAFASNSGMGLLTTIAMDFVSRVTGLLVATWGLVSPVATRNFTLKPLSKPECVQAGCSISRATATLRPSWARML